MTQDEETASEVRKHKGDHMTVEELITLLSAMPQAAKITLKSGGFWAYPNPHDVRQVDDTHVVIVSKPDPVIAGDLDWPYGIDHYS